VSQAFEGLKVLDFSRVIAGPMASEYLALHGATVVRIESIHSPDVLRIALPYKERIPGINRSGYFSIYNANKLSMALDLGHPKAKDVVRRLVLWCDVVVENFIPGTMEKWKLSYSDLRKIRPDIIMLSSSNQGQGGPYSKFTGYGFTLVALSGYTNLTGWPDRLPCHPFGAVTDFAAGYLGSIAIIGALNYRRRTGKGQYLDISQYECGVYMLAPLILAYCTKGKEAGRVGNSGQYAAPHGAYPCKGNDRWCVIAVENDEQWQTFCAVMGNAEMARDSRFCTIEKRLENEEDLNAVVTGWSQMKTAEEVMELLQKGGVPAGVVSTPADLHDDPQLAYRQHFRELKHPEIGYHKYQAPPFRFSGAPTRFTSAAPCLGEHTEYVCTKLLGMRDEEFVQLLEEGALE